MNLWILWSHISKETSNYLIKYMSFYFMLIFGVLASNLVRLYPLEHKGLYTCNQSLNKSHTSDKQITVS